MKTEIIDIKLIPERRYKPYQKQSNMVLSRNNDTIILNTKDEVVFIKSGEFAIKWIGYGKKIEHFGEQHPASFCDKPKAKVRNIKIPINAKVSSVENILGPLFTEIEIHHTNISYQEKFSRKETPISYEAKALLLAINEANKFRIKWLQDMIKDYIAVKKSIKGKFVYLFRNRGNNHD